MQSLVATLKFIAQHPLSSKQPLLAFWRYGRWQIESRLRREVEFDWIEGSKLIVRKGMTGATGNIYCGLHEFADMAFVLHLLRHGDLFVDVGANIGSYTVLASAVCGARSVAVEPDPDTMRSLQRNIAANRVQNRVQLIEAALGSKNGTAQFTVGLDTMNRIAEDGGSKTREVKVRRLDDVLAGMNPCLIKMDVEGYEADVLAGASQTLRNPSLIAIETETLDEEVSRRLQENGFRRCYYEPFGRRLTDFMNVDRGRQSSNALFVRHLDLCRHRLETAPKREIIGQRL